MRGLKRIGPLAAEMGKNQFSLVGKSTPARHAAPDGHPFKHTQVTLYRLRRNI